MRMKLLGVFVVMVIFLIPPSVQRLGEVYRRGGR